MKIIWKGRIIEEADKTLDIQDRGYQFGDGIYEVTRVYNGKCFAVHEHLDRLFNSALKVEMDLGCSREEIITLMETLIEENQLNSGYIYLQFTRGDGIMRNHLFPEPSQSSVVFSGFTSAFLRPVEQIYRGIKVITGADERWAHCDIKSVSMQGNVMAKNKAAKAGASEIIMVRDGIVTEGSASNVLMIKDNTIYSHPDNQFVLPGITKYLVKRCAALCDIPFNEETFREETLYEADEIVMTSSVLELTPVIMVNDHIVSEGRRGPLCEQLQTVFESLVIAECGGLD